MKDWPVPITVEKCPATGNPIVCAGKYRSTSYERLIGRKSDLYEWAEYRVLCQNCPIGKPDMKGRNKWFSDNLGAGFFRAWNGAMWSAWIGDQREYALKLCGWRLKGKPCLSNIKVTRFRQNWPLIEQCIKDGNWHIAPLVHGFGMNPQEFKEAIGKGLWKRLARSSFTRNKAIVDRLYRAEYTQKPASEWARQTLIRRLQSAEILPTRWMSWPFGSDDWRPTIEWYVAECRRSRRVSKVVAATAAHEIQLAADAQRMAQRFGETWTPCGWETMLRRHEAYTRRQNAEYAARPRLGGWTGTLELREPDATPWDTFGWPEVLERDGYKLILLNSEALLRDEGKAMHHCVGSYDRSAKAGSSIIYSVTYKGERVSTAEFGVAQTMTGGSWVVRQNRAVCNQDLPKQHQEPVRQILNNMAAQMNISQPAPDPFKPEAPVIWALEA